MNIYKPKIKTIYDLMKHGLLHPKRWCSVCDSEMRFIYDMDTNYEYKWMCPYCYKTEKITNSTPMIGINIIKFDLVLELWSK